MDCHVRFCPSLSYIGVIPVGSKGDILKEINYLIIFRILHCENHTMNCQVTGLSSKLKDGSFFCVQCMKRCIKPK